MCYGLWSLVTIYGSAIAILKVKKTDLLVTSQIKAKYPGITSIIWWVVFSLWLRANNSTLISVRSSVYVSDEQYCRFSLMHSGVSHCILRGFPSCAPPFSLACSGVFPCILQGFPLCTPEFSLVYSGVSHRVLWHFPSCALAFSLVYCVEHFLITFCRATRLVQAGNGTNPAAKWDGADHWQSNEHGL